MSGDYIVRSLQDIVVALAAVCALIVFAVWVVVRAVREIRDIIRPPTRGGTPEPD